MIFLLIRWKQYCLFLPHFCPRRPSFTNDFWRPTNALIYFHLQEHTSPTPYTGFEREWFAKQCIAPEDGISRSSFSEAINNRGLEQLQFVFQELAKKRKAFFQKSMQSLETLYPLMEVWLMQYYQCIGPITDKVPKKPKVILDSTSIRGYLLMFTGNGKGAERPFVVLFFPLVKPELWIVATRSQGFWSSPGEGKHFVCRIKVGTTKTIIEQNDVNSNSSIFYDAKVILGTQGINQTKLPVRVIGYKIWGVEYFVATDRHDLTADQVATVYKLRWKIETFFQWWKEHLKVYHLIARSEHGLMVQILGGLITYLLMAIYCRQQFDENVSIKRVRNLRTTILNELYGDHHTAPDEKNFKEH